MLNCPHRDISKGFTKQAITAISLNQSINQSVRTSADAMRAYLSSCFFSRCPLQCQFRITKHADLDGLFCYYSRVNPLRGQCVHLTHRQSAARSTGGVIPVLQNSFDVQGLVCDPKAVTKHFFEPGAPLLTALRVNKWMSWERKVNNCLPFALRCPLGQRDVNVLKTISFLGQPKRDLSVRYVPRFSLFFFQSPGKKKKKKKKVRWRNGFYHKARPFQTTESADIRHTCQRCSKQQKYYAYLRQNISTKTESSSVLLIKIDL